MSDWWYYYQIEKDSETDLPDNIDEDYEYESRRDDAMMNDAELLFEDWSE